MLRRQVARLVWFYGGSIAELWGSTPVWQIELLDSELDALQAELALEWRGATAFPHVSDDSYREREIIKLRARAMDGIPFKQRRPRQEPTQAGISDEARRAAIERLRSMPGVKVVKKGGDDGG